MTDASTSRQTGRKAIRLTVVFVISVLFCLIYILFGAIQYDSGDDYALNLICAGAYDPQLSEYLIFCNILYGKLIGFLYRLFPEYNMYFFTVIILNCLAIFSVSFTACEGFFRNIHLPECPANGAKRKALLPLLMDISVSMLTAVIINCFLAENFYISLQFTKNAGLYSATGCLLMFAWLRSGHSLKNPGGIGAVFFLLIGYCVRRMSFLAVVAVALAGVGTWLLFHVGQILGAFFRFIKKKEKASVKLHGLVLRIWQPILVFSLLGVAIAAAFFMNESAYASDEWQTFKKYNIYRSEMLDYGIPSYEENESFYNELGLDKLDVTLLEHWCYADTNKFTIDKMEQLYNLAISNKQPLNINERLFMKTFYQLKHDLRAIGVFLGCILLFHLAMLNRRYDLLGVICALLFVIFCEYYYLTFVGRAPWRVRLLPWLSAFIVFIGLFAWTDGGQNYFQFNKASRAFSCIAVSLAAMIVCFYPLYNTFKNEKNGVFFPESRTKDPFYTTMSERKSNYYIVSAVESICSVPRLDNQYKEYYANITFTGGWSIPSPLWTSNFNRYGITNPLLSLVMNDGNVYFADSSGLQRLLRAYLEKETGQPVIVEQVDTISEIPIWQFRFQ